MRVEPISKSSGSDGRRARACQTGSVSPRDPPPLRRSAFRYQRDRPASCGRRPGGRRCRKTRHADQASRARSVARIVGPDSELNRSTKCAAPDRCRASMVRYRSVGTRRRRRELVHDSRCRRAAGRTLPVLKPSSHPCTRTDWHVSEPMSRRGPGRSGPGPAGCAGRPSVIPLAPRRAPTTTPDRIVAVPANDRIVCRITCQDVVESGAREIFKV